MTAFPTAMPAAPRTLLDGLVRKQQAVAAVIAGGMSLFEAADRFRADDRDDPEAACRTVIGWVHLALRDRPERAEPLTERLERELQSHLARPGRLIRDC